MNQDFFIDLVQSFEDSFSRSSDDLLGLRSSDLLESDASLLLDLLYEMVVLLSVESDTLALLAGSSCSA